MARSINAVFSADFSDFEKAIDRVSTVHIKTFEKGMRDAGRIVERFADQFSGSKVQRDAVAMAKGIEAIGGASKLTAKEQERANRVLDEAIQKFKALGQQAPPELRKIAGEIKQLQDAARQVDFGEIGQQLSGVGTRLTVGLTVPLAAATAGAAKAAIDFESSFAGIVKTVDDATDDFGNLTARGLELQQGMRDLAKEIPVGVNELNKIGEAAGQLGIESQNILGFTRVIADLGATTNLSTDEAATSLARLANITKLPQDQFDRLGSTIVALGNNFATTEREIVDFGLRIAGAGEVAGLTESQILAIGTAMSSVGVEAEAGGSAVQKVLLAMTEAVATGNESLEVFAQTAELSADQFADAFSRNAGDAFARFVTGLGKQGDRAFQTLAKLDLQDQRLIRSFLSLANAGDLLTRSLGVGADAWAENTALAQEAEQRYNTVASQLTLLQNKLNDVAIEIGQALLPAIRGSVRGIELALPVLEDLANGFAALPGSAQALVIGLGAITAAAGPTLFITGQLLKTFDELFGKAGFVTRATAGEFGKLGTAAAGLSRVLGTAGLVGVAALAAKALGDVAVQAREAREETDSWFNRIKEGGLTIAAFSNPISTATVKQKEWEASVGLASEAVLELVGRVKDLEDALPRVGAAAAKAGQDIELSLLGSFFEQADFAQAPSLEEAFRTLAAVERQASTLRNIGQTVRDELAAARSEINNLSKEELAGLTLALKSGTYNLEQLSQETGVSQRALKLLQTQVRTAAAEFKKGERSLEKWARDLKTLRRELESLDFKVVQEFDLGPLGGGFSDEELRELQMVQEQFERTLQLQEEFDREVRRMTRSRVDFELDEIQRRLQAEIDYYRVRGTLSDTLLAALQRNAALETFQVVSSTEQYKLALAGLGAMLPTVFGPLLQYLTEVDLKTEDAATSFSERLGPALEESLTEALSMVPQTIIDGILHGSSAQDVAVAVGSQIGAAIGRAIGAAVGGEAGAAVGAAIGSLAGPLVDAIVKTRAERTVERVAYEFGASISEALAQGIEDTAEERFLGNRQAAKILHLDDILAETGGLNVGNFRQMFARFRDLFSLVETGAFSSADAIEVLDKNFRTFADFVTKGGSLANAELLEIIELSREFGLKSSEVLAFTSEQAGRAFEGIAGFVETRGGIFDALVEAQKNLDELKADRASAEDIAAAQDEVARLQAQLEALPLTAGGAQAFGASLFAIFEELTRAGQTPIAVLQQLDPVIASLDRQLKAAGLSGGAAFREIRDLAALATDEVTGPALEAVASLEAAFSGLHNAGLLTEETFDGLNEQITATFEALLKQGVDSEEALRLIAPTLQTIWELQQDFGYTVDENTQKLLDEAEAIGVVGDEHRTVQEQMLLALDRTNEILEAIAEGFGIEIPEAIDETAGAVEDAEGRIADAKRGLDEFFKGIPNKIGIDVDVSVPDKIRFPEIIWDGPIDRSSGQPIPPDVVRMAAGTNGIERVTGPTWFLAGEAGPEDVWFSGAHRTGLAGLSRLTDAELMRILEDVQLRAPFWDALPVVPMAQGGFGEVDSPTLFLAGERGPEGFWFSGANRRARTAPRGSVVGDEPGIRLVLERGAVQISAIDASGFNAEQVMDGIIEAATKRLVRQDKKARQFAAAVSRVMVR